MQKLAPRRHLRRDRSSPIQKRNLIARAHKIARARDKG